MKIRKMMQVCVCVCLHVAAGSGQLTAIADCDLLGELGWAEPCTAAISVCVCVCVCVREGKRESEREPCKAASV